PVDRSELVPQLEHAAVDESIDRLAGIGERGAMRRVARPLHREHEIAGRLVAPLREARRRLRAVEGAVDLDRPQAAARVLELALERVLRRIEAAPPRLVDPAADADPDLARAPVPHAAS